METIKLRLLRTKFGDEFFAVNGYKGSDGWHIGEWETLANRRDLVGMMDDYETVQEWELPPSAWEMMLDALQRRLMGDAGRVSTPRKAAAVRENGKKGGRPRKKQ